MGTISAERVLIDRDIVEPFQSVESAYLCVTGEKISEIKAEISVALARGDQFSMYAENTDPPFWHYESGRYDPSIKIKFRKDSLEPVSPAQMNNIHYAAKVSGWSNGSLYYDQIVIYERAGRPISSRWGYTSASSFRVPIRNDPGNFIQIRGVVYPDGVELEHLRIYTTVLETSSYDWSTIPNQKLAGWLSYLSVPARIDKTGITFSERDVYMLLNEAQE